jgi:hypothetical protein
VIAEYNASGTVLRRYVHGPGDDEPLVWYEGSGTSDRRWPLADERGSVIAIADGSGTVTQINKYNPYGAPDPANHQGRFQYTGQMWIAEVGLYHFKARAYHPGARVAQSRACHGRCRPDERCGDPMLVMADSTTHARYLDALNAKRRPAFRR